MAAVRAQSNFLVVAQISWFSEGYGVLCCHIQEKNKNCVANFQREGLRVAFRDPVWVRHSCVPVRRLLTCCIFRPWNQIWSLDSEKNRSWECFNVLQKIKSGRLNQTFSLRSGRAESEAERWTKLIRPADLQLIVHLLLHLGIFFIEMKNDPLSDVLPFSPRAICKNKPNDRRTGGNISTS